MHDQLRVEAMWSYAPCAANPTVMGRSQEFFDKTDKGRAGATSTSLQVAVTCPAPAAVSSDR
ncbi:MAG: hypothetical protein ABS81_02165 [Pseudonocardia sp. SCN 72-86]|nr:MAG: hypothetical protein ABS81_02165 [Pseudonocardia sp. SCN 72-86]